MGANFEFRDKKQDFDNAPILQVKRIPDYGLWFKLKNKGSIIRAQIWFEQLTHCTKDQL